MGGGDGYLLLSVAGFYPVDRWIDEFEQLRRHHPTFPSPAVELRTYWAIGTLMHRQPQHPFLRIWSERGLKLLDTGNRDLSILLGGYITVCFLWWGETAKARDVIERLKPWTKSPDVSPLSIFSGHAQSGSITRCGAR